MTQVLQRYEVTEVTPTASEVLALPPPGWYPDTVGEVWLRYWSGTDWTDHTAPTGPPPAPEARSRYVLGRTTAKSGAPLAVVTTARIHEATRLVAIGVAAVVAAVIVTALGILLTA